MLNIECPIARQSSITIFLRHPVVRTRGVRRIGLTPLNPKVFPSNQSESDPK